MVINMPCLDVDYSDPRAGGSLHEEKIEKAYKNL